MNGRPSILKGTNLVAVGKIDMVQDGVPDEVFRTMVPVGEAARILKVHPSTLRIWSDEGLIPSHRVGLRGHRRFAMEDVLALVERRGNGEKPVDSIAGSLLRQQKAQDKVERALTDWLEATSDWMHSIIRAG